MKYTTISFMLNLFALREPRRRQEDEIRDVAM